MANKGGNNVRPHRSEERERTSIALPRSLMERAREHGPGSLLSTIEKAVEIYTLNSVPTFVRDMVEEAAAKDGRPYEQFFLDALVEGVRALSNTKTRSSK